MFKTGDKIQRKDCHSLPPREIIGEDYDRCVYIVREGEYGSDEVPFSDEYRYEKLKFEKIYEHLNRSHSSYHAIDGIVYEAAEKLLKHFRNNPEFIKFNHTMNSEQNVREMFERMTDEWISSEYLDITSSDDGIQSMEKFNILTDPEINCAIKDDVFRLLWNNRQISL